MMKIMKTKEFNFGVRILYTSREIFVGRKSRYVSPLYVQILRKMPFRRTIVNSKKRLLEDWKFMYRRTVVRNRPQFYVGWNGLEDV